MFSTRENRQRENTRGHRLVRPYFFRLLTHKKTVFYLVYLENESLAKFSARLSEQEKIERVLPLPEMSEWAIER